MESPNYSNINIGIHCSVLPDNCDFMGDITLNDKELIKKSGILILGWEYREAGEKWEFDNWDTKPGFEWACGPLEPTMKEIADLVISKMEDDGFSWTASFDSEFKIYAFIFQKQTHRKIYGKWNDESKSIALLQAALKAKENEVN